MELQNSLKYEKQVRAIVLFGDIRGFSTWEQSATNPEVEFKPLMNRWRQAAEEFGQNLGAHCSIYGDGAMLILEMKNGHNCGLALKVMGAAFHFTHSVIGLIRKAPWPRPQGFRVRVASGYVWKRGDGQCGVVQNISCGSSTDYVGRHINMTSKLLRVKPEEPIICHQSFVELMTKSQIKKSGFSYKKIAGEWRTPEGILKTDINALWRLEKGR
jgi:class 3 adenylate cyclase